MDKILQQLLSAQVYDVAKHTPLQQAPLQSNQLENHVWFKREDLQPGFSFKVRGAYNKIVHLSAAECKKGVICASAGNHAQGVALASARLGIKSRVVMPRTTPAIKLEAVKALGAEIILHGDSFSEASQYCETLLKTSEEVFIHPFDDTMIIAGQSTIGQELYRDHPNIDAVFVPVGGGGLIAGIGLYLKFVKSNTKIIAVEAEDSNSLQRALQSGERIMLNNVGLFADGVAVKQVGTHTFDYAKKVVDQVVTVNTDAICSAMKDIYQDTRAIVEPSGALALAGMKQYVQQTGCKDKVLVAINSGANVNFQRLQFVAERTMVGEKQEALFALKLPERPGVLRHFCQYVVKEHAITEFNYRYSDKTTAHVFIGIGVSSPQEKTNFSTLMSENDYAHFDLTDNELAKSHIRHMVGGHAPFNSNDELLYTFEFPERPRALLDFLLAMDSNWNISLFHYRMHGGDFGRVLVGFQIPPAERASFQHFLDKLNYHYQNESTNPARTLFL